MIPTLPCQVLKSGEILSPGVGVFVSQTAYATASGTAIGTLERLGKRFLLMVPQGNGIIRMAIASGSLVMAGDCLAQMTEDALVSPTLCADRCTIQTPSDGFISWIAPSGQPYKSPGDTVLLGDTIAVLEFMKIRLEIAYQGSSSVIFERYCVPSSSAVLANDVIAQCKS